LDDINLALKDHLAEDIIVIDLKGKSDIADYMVIATGQSGRQVSTMADRLIEAAKRHGIKGISPEGKSQGDWVLIDAGDIIIHLFRPEVRKFYNLEKMWTVNIPNIETPTKL
tara:strand:+ start:1761 stop:2096 length:336 start_codon:yes stop_codon:yes gene_type:complete